MTSVRGYEEQDREAVIGLCLEDAGAANAGEETRRYTALTRCEYYIGEEPDNCFVAVDDEDGIVGCILCAANTDAFERAFTENWVPKAAALGARRYVDAKLSILPVTMYRQYYPAHFIMYVKSSWYGRGVGELLLAALRGRLRRRHITKLMTVCGDDGDMQSSFLEKQGFNALIRTKYGLSMGLEIKD